MAGAPRAAGVSAVVTTVVTFRGPGSWKRDAYWDEYTLTRSNPGQAALTVESAVLRDRYGELVAAGGEPWTLEKQSRTYQQHHLSTTGEALKIGGGAIASSAAGLLGGAAIGALIGNPAGWVIVPTWAAGAGIAAIAVRVGGRIRPARRIAGCGRDQSGCLRAGTLLRFPVSAAPPAAL